jgi:hypothetical protein
LTTLYFDETGHTGTNLLDRDQPFLAYGGLRTNEQESIEIIQKYFGSVKMAELHHNELCRRRNGQQAVLEFLEKECHWIRANFKWFLIHKAYGLLTKVVDLVIEPAAYERGENLYDGGLAQQIALFIWIASIERGQAEALNNFLAAFNELGISPTPDHLALCERAAFAVDLGNENNVILRLPFQQMGMRLILRLEKDYLDLSFSGAFMVAELWWNELAQPFELIHDRGAALLRQQAQWAAMTDPSLPYRTMSVGPYDPVVNLPLIRTSFEESRTVPGLQLVDVILGARRKLVEWVSEGKPSDPYCENLFEVLGPPTADQAIVPNLDLREAIWTGQTATEADTYFSEIINKIPVRQRYSPQT